jgi:hypothetical protein
MAGRVTTSGWSTMFARGDGGITYGMALNPFKVTSDLSRIMCLLCLLFAGSIPHATMKLSKMEILRTGTIS